MLRLIIISITTLIATVQVYSQESTWSQIQGDILSNNCVLCHYAGSSFARQSGLVLTQDVAYENLVNVQPRNSSAAADSLVRISSEGGMMGLGKSFLWEKVNAPDQLHFFDNHPNYGAIMPFGLPYLTFGELAFPRRSGRVPPPWTGARCRCAHGVRVPRAPDRGPGP